MDPIRLVKLAWSDAQARILFPAIVLMAGVALAYFPTTGGRMVCDRGMCIQEQTAAFGTVREAIIYPSSDIRGIRIERTLAGVDREGQTQPSRVVIDTASGSLPLTAAYTHSERATEYVARQAERFLATDINERLVISANATGLPAFFKPVSLLLMLVGTGFAGWVLSSMRLPVGRRRH